MENSPERRVHGQATDADNRTSGLQTGFRPVAPPGRCKPFKGEETGKEQAKEKSRGNFESDL